MVFVGRPFLFAAAYAREPGAARDFAAGEGDRPDMAMLGARRIDDIRPELLVEIAAAEFPSKVA